MAGPDWEQIGAQATPDSAPAAPVARSDSWEQIGANYNPQQDAAATMRGNLQQSATNNPDQAAQQQRIAKQLGVPPQVAAGMPNETKSLAAQQQFPAEVTGYLTGAPLGQFSSTTQFLWDVYDGQEDPQGLSQWWTGLETGRLPRH